MRAATGAYGAHRFFRGKALGYLENRLKDPRFRLTAGEAELIGKVCEKIDPKTA